MEKVSELKKILLNAENILIGAGAGLSTAAGFTYDGERFQKYFADFGEAYGFSDMYSGGFYPYDTPEEFWGFWCRNIFYNRYDSPKSILHQKILDIVREKNYFVLTTNVDHLFQLNGFDKSKLFYTQGDYGLFQCSKPCHNKTYDNEQIIRAMIAAESNLRVPTKLLPHCPKCGELMTTNLRIDDTFVQDSGWYAASYRYKKFLNTFSAKNIVFLELGVGLNTPGIIKYPFWRLTAQNPRAHYISINKGEIFVPKEISKQSLAINADISEVIDILWKN